MAPTNTEHKALQSSYTFRVLADNLRDGLAIADLETSQIIYANAAFCQLYGFDPDETEVLNWRVPQFWPERLHGYLKTEVIPAIKSGGWSGEVPHKHLDGEEFMIAATVFPLMDESGKPIAMAAQIRDISAEKKAESEQRQLSNIIEATSDAVAIADMDMKLLYANQATYRLLGLPEDADLIGTAIPEVMVEEDLPLFQVSGEAAIKDGTWRGEMRLVAADGEIIPVSSVVIAHKDAEGNPVALTNVARDLREVRAQESNLRTFQTLAENAPYGIAITNLVDGLHSYANPAYQKMSGQGEAATTMPISELVAPGQEQVVETMMADAVALGRWDGEVEYQRADGTRFPAQVAIFALRDNSGKATDLAALVRDVTLEKAAEAQRARMQEEIINAQQAALQELSTPIIPVMDRVIVMPLIGSIDTRRSREITRSLLAGISTYRAKIIIIDITGVAVVDSGVADHLNKTIQAARLKGAETIVTGISDAVAETIVDLGIDWSAVTTLGNLQTGLNTALDRVGYALNEKTTSRVQQNGSAS